jgi:hypothetical protein
MVPRGEGGGSSEQRAQRRQRFFHPIALIDGLTGAVLARSGKQIIDGDSTHFDLIDNDRDLIARPTDEFVFIAPRRRMRIDLEFASGQIEDPVSWNACPRIGRYFLHAIPSQ